MDTTRLADMADPALNPHFSRGWRDPPDLERERPRTANAGEFLGNFGRDSTKNIDGTWPAFKPDVEGRSV
jgi:hypothetical protein